MNIFTTTTLFARRLSLLFFLAFSISFTTSGQGTALAPGDIMVLQIDEDEQDEPEDERDNFIFVTFVELAVGTTIYFTDCGVFPGTGKFTDPTATTNGSNVNEYPNCPEGAVKFVAPSSIDAGSIFQYTRGVPSTLFTNHTDALITGELDFYTKGDQVVVFQQKTGTAYPSEDPDFIFILNADAGFFNPNNNSNHSPYYITPDPNSPQENEGSGTSIPTGLDDDNSTPESATAMAVGEGTAEIDNVIFNGTGLIPFVGSTEAEKIRNAKIAILAPLSNPTGKKDESNGLNWFGESNTGQNDPEDILYFQYENLLANAGNILPTELITFIGSSKIKTIDLHWATASETNNDYFAIEKSTNEVDFEETSQVDGKGTTTSTSNYNWTDQSPKDGLNYYRLRQVDYNGDKSYSEIIVIEF